MESKRNLLELDVYSDVITDLGFDSEKMYEEADVLVNLELAEQLKKSSFTYYRELKERRDPIIVRFSGYREKTRMRSDELFVIFGTVELVYPIERVLFEGTPDATMLLNKEYKVYISDVIESENRVILSDSKENTRRQAMELISQKLEKNEEIYLRGNIIGLQRNGGDKASQMAAYVNIEGLGIIGIIPIKRWSVGYMATECFRETVRNNVNAIVNFRVCSITKVRYGRTSKLAFVCSRCDFLSKIGYNPWTIVGQTLKKRSVVKVRIIEVGKTKASFFGAIDGIPDFNMLCFKDDASPLKFDDIVPGRYYYGYVQKVKIDPENSKNNYLRVRLTGAAKQDSDDAAIKKNIVQSGKE